jgi:hypothetical protein
MAVDLNRMIMKMEELKTKGITYSMFGSRVGTDGTADCSGAVYTALKAGGGSQSSYVPSTETLHSYLNANGFSLISEGFNMPAAQKGDLFIWGKKGQSAGANGHTGIFYNSSQMIHCNAYANGISIDNAANVYSANGRPYCYLYRMGRANAEQRRFGYRVDDLQLFNGVWQIRNDYLVPVQFEWYDNGILPADVEKITQSDGKVTTNQTLNKGDYFAFKPSAVLYVDTPVMIAGYQFMRVHLQSSGIIWLSVYNKEHLIYG